MASLMWRRSLVASFRHVPRTIGRSTTLSVLARYKHAEAVAHRSNERDGSDTNEPAEPGPIPIDPAERTSVPFSTLQGKISNETLNALAVEPFKLENMTHVQEEVLGLMPDLVSATYKDVPDLLVKAKTGTGKTLAFLVPAVEARLKALAASQDPRKMARSTVGTLIISPTRELASQIATEALRLTSQHQGMQVHLLTGGTDKSRQLREWMKGRRDIVVATPGRLTDLLSVEEEVRRGIASTGLLVFDEADTLLDLGFRDDIDRILTHVPPVGERQAFLVSATLPANVRSVARASLSKDYKVINTVSADDSPVHAHVPQYSTLLPSAKWELPHVMRLIAHDQFTAGLKHAPGYGYGSKVVVFLPTTKKTQLYATAIRELARDLLPAGKETRVFELHSKKSQSERERSSQKFRESRDEHTVLVTSDVSARGVDYAGVTRVIQIGIPQSPDQYIHRVGRTGRGGPDRMVPGRARGDLILQPWEVGFLTWQLTDVPLKPLHVNDLVAEMKELSMHIDEIGIEQHWKNLNPDTDKPRPIKRRKGQNQRGTTKDVYPWTSFEKQFPYSPLASTDFYDSSIRVLLPRLDEESVREVFLSLLGYYTSKAVDMRVSKHVVLQGCKDWTTEAMGLSVPPFVSDAFLMKLGFGLDDTHSRRTRVRREAYDSGVRFPRFGLKNKEARRMQEAMAERSHKERRRRSIQTEEDDDAEEYRTLPYFVPERDGRKQRDDLPMGVKARRTGRLERN